MTRSSGFTLIELLVVVAIIGILSAVGTLAYTGYVSGAKKSSAENYLQQISLAQTEEYSSTGEYFISSSGTASACTAGADSSSELETNLFSGENVLPDDIDLSNEKVIGIDNEALGLVLGRDPLTLVQLGLESKKFYLIKLNRDPYSAPNLIKT